MPTARSVSHVEGHAHYAASVVGSGRRAQVPISYRELLGPFHAHPAPHHRGEGEEKGAEEEEQQQRRKGNARTGGPEEGEEEELSVACTCIFVQTFH